MRKGDDEMSGGTDRVRARSRRRRQREMRWGGRR